MTSISFDYTRTDAVGLGERPFVKKFCRRVRLSGKHLQRLIGAILN